MEDLAFCRLKRGYSNDVISDWVRYSVWFRISHLTIVFWLDRCAKTVYYGLWLISRAGRSIFVFWEKDFGRPSIGSRLGVFHNQSRFSRLIWLLTSSIWHRRQELSAVTLLFDYFWNKLRLFSSRPTGTARVYKKEGKNTKQILHERFTNCALGSYHLIREVAQQANWKLLGHSSSSNGGRSLAGIICWVCTRKSAICVSVPIFFWLTNSLIVRRIGFDGSYMGHWTYVSFVEDISSRFEDATRVKSPHFSVVANGERHCS